MPVLLKPCRRGRRTVKNRSCANCHRAYTASLGVSPRYCVPCMTAACLCRACGTSFTIKRKDLDDGRGKYCSRSCAGTHPGRIVKGAAHWKWKGGLCSDRKSYQRAHRQSNAQRYVQYTLLRQAKVRGAAGEHSLEQWEQLKAAHAYRCLRCNKCEPDIKLTRDHKVPISRGGSNDINNIQPLCISCNSKKHTKTIFYSPNVTAL